MKKPDIIFVVLDTQRADRLGAYGHERAVTPNLDRFAEAGVLFEQAVAPAQWTIPSHASLFTGLYPTAHQITQSTHSLNPDLPHLVEVMRAAGYETVGFCNNPLVGILNNGFKRGFDTFYNYGGAFPSVPESSSRLPWPLNQASEWYTQFLRRISYPIQNFFGQSDLAFRVSLNAWLTPLWSRFANFKGQNERSVRDVTHFLRERERQNAERPLFLFLNLMETHMPFWPPGEFIDQVAPYFRHNKEARTIMRTWNREAYRWAAPLDEPLSDLESQVLSDMYDAEVAYQDHYLGQLLTLLNGRRNQENTLTLIVADHGDGLGEHGYMGHAFVAYEELVHVPLIMHWPGQIKPNRIATPVSTRRVFHTLLDAVGPLPEMPTLNPTEIHALTLMQTIYGRDPERHTAFSEIYPPMNFVKAIERRQVHLLEQYRCLSLRRAVVKTDETANTLKLIEVDEQLDELFDLRSDPAEIENLLPQRPLPAAAMAQDLKRMVAAVERQQQAFGNGRVAEVDIDETLLQRLRGLGYVD
ncbi:MAG: sulfatase [Anaerolineales bacterium]|nr:sulfatase [Anaerolineales bacterium]